MFLQEHSGKNMRSISQNVPAGTLQRLSGGMSDASLGTTSDTSAEWWAETFRNVPAGTFLTIASSHYVKTGEVFLQEHCGKLWL